MEWKVAGTRQDTGDDVTIVVAAKDERSARKTAARQGVDARIIAPHRAVEPDPEPDPEPVPQPQPSPLPGSSTLLSIVSSLAIAIGAILAFVGVMMIFDSGYGIDDMARLRKAFRQVHGAILVGSGLPIIFAGCVGLFLIDWRDEWRERR